VVSRPIAEFYTEVRWVSAPGTNEPEPFCKFMPEVRSVGHARVIPIRPRVPKSESSRVESMGQLIGCRSWSVDLLCSIDDWQRLPQFPIHDDVRVLCGG